MNLFARSCLAALSLGAIVSSSQALAAKECTPALTSDLTVLDVVDYWQKDATGLLYACTEQGVWMQARVDRYSCAGSCAPVLVLADGTETRTFPPERLFRQQDLEGKPEGAAVIAAAQKLGS